MNIEQLHHRIDTGASFVEAAYVLSKILAEGASHRDATRTLPQEEMRLVRQAGLQAIRIDRDHGGPDLSFVDFAAVMMHLAAGDPNVAQAIQPHFTMIEWLRLDGSPAQREKYFRAILDGAIVGNAFAERGTGVVGQLGTRLVGDGAGYRLTGVKFYSTGSLFSDYLHSPAMTDDGTQAIAIFPIDRQGVRMIDDWDGMGQRTTASGTTHLEHVPIEAGEVISLTRIKERRIYIGAAAQLGHVAIDVGIAKGALEDAIKYAPKARPTPESGVQKAADDPYVMHAIGEMTVMFHSAEAMMRRAGATLDRAANAQLGGMGEGTMLDGLLRDASIAVAESKATATDACLRISEMMFRVGGASMTLRTHNFDRHWRNARTHTTHDPVAYKYKAIGDYYLNDRGPGISTKI